MRIETAFPQLYTIDKFSSCNSCLLLLAKLTFMGGNNKTVVWSAACPIFDLFGKGEPILGSTYASPNMGSPLPNKSDIKQQATK